MKPTEGELIICGTDFSENAQGAADIAAAFAARLDLPLVLVHAHLRIVHALIPDLNGTPAHLLATASDPTVRALLEAPKRQAERLRERLGA